MSEKRWIPLESNPETLSHEAHALGMATEWRFHDLLGFDPELLSMVPTPVLAVLMLFPISEQTEEFRRAEQERITRQGQAISPDVWFVKQTISNACGTIGILHAVANNSSALSPQNSFLRNFLNATRSMSPEERAVSLEKDEELERVHEQAAAAGQSKVPDRSEEVPLHFVCFIASQDGNLIELDGRKTAPINHGPCTRTELLQKSVQVVQQYMALNPGELHYSVLALGPSTD